MKPFSLLLLSLAAAAPTQVGTEFERGPFAAMAHDLSLRQQTGAMVLVRKPVGDASAPPALPSQPLEDEPDFRPQTLFGPALPYVDVDAMSTGNDLLPIHPVTGDLDPGRNGGWMALTFSVTSGTVDTAEGVVRQRSLRPERAGADLFGYFLRDSNADPASLGIPIELIDKVFLQQGNEHIGIASTQQNQADMDAHDAYMPWLAIGPLPEDLGFVRTRTDFFFSVTPASAALLESQRGGTLANWLPASTMRPGDVYRLTWNNGQWSTPSVFRTAVELVDNPDADVDALAIDLFVAGGLGQAVLFSTVGDPVQLRLQPPNGPVREARTPIGPIRLIDTGDVDAVCSYDPESGTGFNRWIGFPLARIGVSPKIGFAIAGDGADYRLIVSGWGDSGPAAGLVHFYIAPPDVLPTAPFLTLPRPVTAASMELPILLDPMPDPGTAADLLAVYEPYGGSPLASWAVRVQW